MKNILLPTDFSKNSLNAIDYAMNLLQNESCNFYLVNVQTASSFISDDIMSASVSTSIYNTLIGASKKSVNNIISIVKEEYNNEKHNFFSVVDYDNFIDSINQISENYNIDLIIMGTKGASGLEKALFGSNTVRVIQRCEVPVLAIPDGCVYEGLSTIAYTTNNLTLLVSKALAVLNFIKQLNNSKLNILHVADEHHIAHNQNNNVAFFKTYFSDTSHDYLDSNSRQIFNNVQNYIKDNNIKMLAMMSKKHSFLERLFTRHTVETFAFKINIPFLVMHSQEA
ncbi:universal stress protein [Tamlana sp. 2201CG12-4]|uniref:universal stress protein n=1 Tax=Tamlana sp. 2201CG12-4 TaxID=3112582 RepID=UPI002DBDEB74|nr:universal stress protein [Tamlana sp. 2201CG12-4]MEC3908530.1 universal stress protein [Tamlana sp. 2201CG12-4]